MAEGKGTSDVTERTPKDELRQAFQQLMTAMAGRAMSGATNRVGGVTNKLSSMGSGNSNGDGNGNGNGGGAKGKVVEKLAEKTAEGESPVKAGMSAGFSGIKEKVKGVFGKGGNGDKKKSGRRNLKVTNIIEEIDVGAPIDVVYNAWTQFQDWSDFMKKLEQAERDEKNEEEQKIDFKAQVLWSHRSWQGHVLEQIPNERIIWRSKGEKGRVDGAVSFHELAPNLTRVVVVLEYYPQGFFEQTGNLWRAPGRRARLELKHFQRHVMSEVMLHPDQLDELEGWRGEVHDGEVTKSHEDAMRESEEQGDQDEGEQDEHGDRDAEDEQDVRDADDEQDEDAEQEDEDEDGEQDEYGDEDAEDEYDEDEDEDEVEDEDEQPSENGRARRRARTGSR